MSRSDGHTVGETPWKIRLVQALDSDPMFHPATFTYSVEASEHGFEVVVIFAPIYYHLASSRERLALSDTAADLVRAALDAGIERNCEVRVSSDGVALVDGQPIASLFRLTTSPPAPKAAHHG